MQSVVVRLPAKITVEVREVVVIQKPDFCVRRDGEEHIPGLVTDL